MKNKIINIFYSDHFSFFDNKRQVSIKYLILKVYNFNGKEYKYEYIKRHY